MHTLCIYVRLQEPLLNATTGSEAANPFAGLLGAMGGAAAGTGPGAAGATNQSNSAASGSAADQPSSQPLPNPWAPAGANGV